MSVNKMKIAVCLVVSAAILTACKTKTDANPDHEWRTYLGAPSSSQYSELDQINTKNVHQLKVAWAYQTGDKRENDQSQIQCNPIVVDGVLYATSPRLKVFALNAVTGENIWTFDPFSGYGQKELASWLTVNRGVTYWEGGSDKRILYAATSYLYALNALTGKPIPEFGTNGRVDLHEGLDRDARNLLVVSTTPGIIYEDFLILGTRVSEGSDAAPGHIRAYNVRTGKIEWLFRTIPRPGEFGYDTWPEDAWKRIGGANCWSGMSLDEERGLVFCPTGSASFDFWGGNRLGQNLFANSVIALNAATGERVWHFQTVHHDLWDRDLPAPPNLVTVEHDGRRIDAVAQITKSGYVFLLNRDTGEPLFPVEERPVLSSNLLGELTWPTQPFPLKPPPFARQSFTEELVTDISEESYNYVLERLKKTRTGQQFIPPSEQGTMIFPGFDGGGEWGGAAFDPESGIMYVNANEMPWILTMVNVASQKREGKVSTGEYLYNVACASCHGVEFQGDSRLNYPGLTDIKSKSSESEVSLIIEKGMGAMQAFGFFTKAEKSAITAYLFDKEGESSNTVESKESAFNNAAWVVPYAHTGYNRFFDPFGYPAIKPPWGTLNAIDLNKGEIVWQVPLGEFPELTKRGIPPTGTENYGGPIVTAGGLIFIGASRDEKFRAFDEKTGEVLWETQLPAGGYATPCTYEAAGKQYVVIAAGGGKMGTKSGASYIAFSLPDRLKILSNSN